jgi:hypothetical protein
VLTLTPYDFWRRARMPCIMPAPAISNGMGTAMSIPSPLLEIVRKR